MTIQDIVNQAPVIPVIVIDNLDDAVPLAKALVKGGLTVLEITLRTGIALEAIQLIGQSVEGATVGAGTVTQQSQFIEASRRGAQFAVSPGLTPEIASYSKQSNLPLLPGVATASEMLAAQAQGFSAMKFFPAEQAGGAGFLKAIHSPLPDIQFCPTGGLNADNFLSYLALPNVSCVGGSWVCPASAVKDKNWSLITQLAANACSMAR